MVHRPALFLTQTAVVCMVAAVHLTAMQWFLYWYYPWLDLLTHFLGGLWIALASAWLLSYASRRVGFIRLILAVMIIGIGWEVFELLAGIPKEANFVFDTSLDLLFDFLGAVIGFTVARHLLKSDTITIQ